MATIKFDRDKYFDAVRASLFDGHMTQEQVDGQETILTVWEALPSLFPSIAFDTRWLAYMLATTYHETAYTMRPIKEYGSESYLQSRPYYPYIGRGYVQLTWDYNYERATDELNLRGEDDLLAHPDRALDPVIAAKVLFKGMYQGWFTGRFLGQYFNASVDDPVNAREIINGNDCDEMIAGYHSDFLSALLGAVVEEPQPQPPVRKSQVVLRINSTYDVDIVVYVNGEHVA